MIDPSTVPADPRLSVEYDLMATRDSRTISRRIGIADLEQATEELTQFRNINPSLTWFLVKRTTTVTEEVLDD